MVMEIISFVHLYPGEPDHVHIEAFALRDFGGKLRMLECVDYF